MMARASFAQKLKKIGDLPVPDGHARVNKGITSYFFAPEKYEEVKAFLHKHLPGCKPSTYYAHGLQFEVMEGGWLKNCVLLFAPSKDDVFVTVCISIWRS